MSKNLPAKKVPGLPASYIDAKNAIQQCARIDECKSWSDKAAALRVYGMQIKDESLINDAKRIRARAVQRGGELLAKLEASKGGRTGRRGSTSLRREAAKDAGLSKDDTVQMMRVANVPKEVFEEMVESQSPPTVKTLADIGIQRRQKPKPEPYGPEWIDWTHAVNHLASLPACGLDVLIERIPAKLPSMREDAKRALVNLKLWNEALQ